MPKESVTLRTSPKDFFLHLMTMFALYASTISFSTVVFQCINLWVPDAVQGFEGDYRGTLRIGASFLIVFFPTFLFCSWSLAKTYLADPAKAHFWVRKWLVYFTLFVSAVILLITSVILIYNFLAGEVTLRFFLKILTVVVVAGAVFGYYLNDIKKHKLN